MFESKVSQNHQKPPPCRTCTDFKSWAKQQRLESTISAKSENDVGDTVSIINNDILQYLIYD